MLDSMQEIKSNPFINRLTDIAQSYGVSGVYVNWNPGGLTTEQKYLPLYLRGTNVNSNNGVALPSRYSFCFSPKLFK